MRYVLKSSNTGKMQEFVRYGFDIDVEIGDDIVEVDGTPSEIIIYKSIASGVGTIVEDTCVFVDGTDIGTNIKYRVPDLIYNVGKSASWQTYVGKNTGTHIIVYMGEVKGIISMPLGDGYGFDPYFIPNGTSMTLAELDNIGQKDNFSARKKAVENMVNNVVFKMVDISKINPWTGNYQV